MSLAAEKLLADLDAFRVKMLGYPYGATSMDWALKYVRDALPAIVAEARAEAERQRDALREAILSAVDFERGPCPWCHAYPTHRDECIAVLALSGAASRPAQEPPAPSLDAAWAEAEAALPEGWAIDRVYWRDDITWSAWAANTTGGGLRGDGDTPAAALRALAAVLR